MSGGEDVTVDRQTIQVSAVLHQGDTFAAVSARTAGGNRMRVVGKGRAFVPVVGEVYDVSGGWYQSRRWGWQFYAGASSFRRMLPSGLLVLPWLTKFEGIGPDRARRLVETFADLDAALSGGASPDAVAAAIDPGRPLLAARIAGRLFEEWRTVGGEYRTVRWLEERGFDQPRTGIMIAELMGPSAVDLIENNPYLLAGILPWASVDRLAVRMRRSAGAKDDPRHRADRVVGAVEAAMQAVVRAGHTAVTKVHLVGDAEKLLDLPPADGLSERIAGLALRNGAVVDAGDRWRAPGCAVMEEELARRFDDMAAGRMKSSVRIPVQVDLGRIVAMVGRGGLAPTEEQREAVEKLLTLQIGCLTGGAGTGKTTTCRLLAGTWEAIGGRVELAAVSGKAALRLAAGVGRGPKASPALTVYRLLLGLRKRRIGKTHWSGASDDDAALELPALTKETLLIIDEASMIDLGQVHQIVELMPDGCRLLFIGDDFQLPPVGFGMIFQHLVKIGSITARLTEVKRQSAESGIPHVAAAIRRLETPKLPIYGAGITGVSMLDVADGDVSDAIERVYDDLGGFEEPDAVMVITAVRFRSTRPDGTMKDVNRRFHARNVRAKGGVAVRGHLGHSFCVGDPVTYLRNDYATGLRNGSLGRIVAADGETHSIVCLFDGDEHVFDHRGLVDVALAYAMTCHRAQGSQTPSVVISMVDALNVDPSWLYTAITRAQERAILVGPMANLDAIMRRQPACDRRMTGFNLVIP